MKKFLALVLSIVMVVTCFAGCAVEKEKEKEKDSKPAIQTEVPVDTDEGNGEVNKELNASKLMFADTMSLAEKIPEGAEAVVNISLAVTPTSELVIAAIPEQFSSFITEKSDGSYEIAISLVGTADENGSKIVVKVGNKEITDVIFTSDAKVFVNLKSIWNVAKDVLSINIPIDLPADYIELTDIIELLNTLELLNISDEILNIEDLLWDMAMDTSLSEEEIMTLVTYFGGEEMGAEFAAIFEQFDGVTSTILNNTELNAFLNTILVKASEAKLFAVTESSMSLNLNKDSVKNTISGVCDVIRTDACNVAESLVNGLNAIETLDEELKAGLEAFNKEEIQKEIESLINVDSILKEIDDEFALIGASYLLTEFSVTENSLESKIELSVDGTNIEEMKDVLKNTKLSASAAVTLKAVETVKAPTSVFGAEDLEMFSSLFSLLG